MTRFLIAAALCLAASPAYAHVGAGPVQSFQSGVLHPLGGLDHMAAMVAVGLWAAINGGRKVWIWPVAFVVTMLAGAGLGFAGVGLPYVEPAIAASVIILGILAALALKAPTAVGAVLIALFAVAHGQAHGTELGEAAAGAYMTGFAFATAALHGVGIVIALVGTRIAGMTPARVAGAATALAGVSLLIR